MSDDIFEVTGDKLRITLKNDLVASSVAELRSMLKEHIKDGVREASIDMSGIKNVDSMGIGFLISIQNSLGKEGGGLIVTGLSADMLDLFQSMKLDNHFSIRGE